MTVLPFGGRTGRSTGGSGSVLLRPWRPGDITLLLGAEGRLSTASLTSRFFTGTSRLPASYLRHVETARPGMWDAVVALDDGLLVGWAEYGRSRDCPSRAELGVTVVDGWQHRGLGVRLVRALLRRAVRAGVRTLDVDIQEGNRAARGMLAAVLGTPAVADHDGDVLHYVVPLNRVRTAHAFGGTRRAS